MEWCSCYVLICAAYRNIHLDEVDLTKYEGQELNGHDLLFLDLEVINVRPSNFEEVNQFTSIVC